MSEKTYISSVVGRAPRPRSKRLRESGVVASGGSSATVVFSGGQSATIVNGSTHTHSNLNTLEQFSTDTSGYLWLTQIRERTHAGETSLVVETDKVRAGYADKAHDLDEDSPVRNEFLSKTHNDTAQGLIEFRQGFKSVDLASFMSDAEFSTLLRSPRFVKGFDGEGWRLWLEEGLSHLEVDRLTVRQIMTVFEMVIDRIRSVGGQIVVSAANGKIRSVSDNGDSYIVTFEGDNYFQAHDLIRCHVFTGSDTRGYWVEVSSADTQSVTIPKSEFAPWGTVPKEGDEVVLMGNTQNTDRQNLISISATEDGQPRIDVLDNVRSKDFSGSLRCRVGNLDGISDSHFPSSNQPHGDGLYADNAYLRGTFILSTGEDVRTKFEIIEGSISSVVEGVRHDLTDEKGLLSNPNFLNGMDKWHAYNLATLVGAEGGLLIEGDGFFRLDEDRDREVFNLTTLFRAGDSLITLNGRILSHRGQGVGVTNDLGTTAVNIFNGRIVQLSEDFRTHPSIIVRSGLKQAVPVRLTFLYRVERPGILSVEFENTDNEGFEEYDPFACERELGVTEGYERFEASGLWNGTGDFSLSFTGEISIYQLLLTSEGAEVLEYTYRTLFEQSERLIRLSAAVYDRNEELLRETGLVVSPEGSGIFARDAEGNVALIGATIEETVDGESRSVVKLQADNISLEGIVTANQGFKVLEDGSIETNNAKIDGYLYTKFRAVEESDAQYADGCYTLRTNLNIDATDSTILLPTDSRYEGARVLLLNSNFLSRLDSPTTVRTADGDKIVSGLFDQSSCEADQVTSAGGTIEFSLCNLPHPMGGRSLRWVLISSSSRVLGWSNNGILYQHE